MLSKKYYQHQMVSAVTRITIIIKPFAYHLQRNIEFRIEQQNGFKWHDREEIELHVVKSGGKAL